MRHRSTTRSRRGSSHCYSNLAGTKLTQHGKVKITKISNPADLATKHLDGGSIRRALERCHCYIREGSAGIALRAEAQEITRSHPEVFTVDNACEVAETEMESEQY